jgi:hypothetical protein
MNICGFFSGDETGFINMNEDALLKRIYLLEYHQKLLLKLLSNPKLDLYKLIIEKSITEQQFKDFLRVCDELSMKMVKQKAEGFIYFYPLFNEFSSSLPRNLKAEEVVPACISQHIFEPLMMEFVKYINGISDTNR